MVGNRGLTNFQLLLSRRLLRKATRWKEWWWMKVWNAIRTELRERVNEVNSQKVEPYCVYKKRR